MFKQLERHSWTKEEIKKLTTLWDTHSLDELSKAFKLDKKQVQYMANTIRAAGYKLQPKRRNAYLRTLITEALGLPKSRK